MRVGLGVDVHPFAGGRPLVVGGIVVPCELGLQGHSDADVLSHAIADALLGAAGLGDLGRHFPSSDERWRNCSSLEFLEQIRGMLQAAGWQVVNVDAVVMAEAPKLSPHVSDMSLALSRALGVDSGAVSVKATTCDGLGAIGRREGIAAQAVALIEAASVPPVMTS